MIAVQNKKKQLSGAKSLIRSLEGFWEIFALTIVYYITWRKGYDHSLFPAYFGYGKYVLAGVYALLVLVLFFAYDGFKFGYLRKTADESDDLPVSCQFYHLLAAMSDRQ